MNRKISVNLALAIVIIAMTVTFSVTMILSQNIFDKTVSSVREKEIMYNKLAEIDKNVRAKYFGDINDDTLLDFLATGYIQAIGDRDAKYYTNKRYLEYLNEQKGQIIGVGIELVKETGAYPKIIRVFPGSPAADAGVQKGNTLIKVDDVDVKNLTLDQTNALVRGDAGTNVTLVTNDMAGNELPAVEMQRRQYQAYTIEYEQRPGESIGYIKILTFNETTSKEVLAAIEKMSNSEQGLTGLILDVRNNLGGDLNSALETIDVLCPAGPVASQQNKQGEKSLLFSSNMSAVELPMAVLTNGNTAAGAELLASSVRDFNLGKIVGTKTAGKGGLMCDPQRLTDGSAISYKVGLLLTKEDFSFDGVGIEPDVETVLKPEDERNFNELNLYTDTQIAKAIEVVKALVNLQPVYDEKTAPSGNGVTSEVSSDPSAEPNQDSSTAQ